MNKQQFEPYLNIPKEKFEISKREENLRDVKLDTKPVGYLRDAFRRFCKNRASVVAAIIILLIVVYAIFVPLFTFRFDANFLDTYYAKMGPRNLALSKIGLAQGAVIRDSAEKDYIYYLGLGIAAEDTDGTGKTWEDGRNSKYNPVLGVKDQYEFMGANRYELKIESYYEVGFKYMQLTREEYENIEAWEKESGLKVLYPYIDVNSGYCFDGTDANFWYKTDAKLNPIVTSSGSPVIISKVGQLQLEDNYLRDSQGNVRYYVNVGGSATTEPARMARVLYYNYYVYKNGFEPEYLLGTDSQGYDMSLRLAQGIKLSLLVAIAVSAINLTIGALYGAVEGYYGGALDLTLERVSDILSGIPFIVVATLFQLHLATKVGAIPSLLFAFVATGWIGTASTERTQFYRFKNQEYVLAARTLGARDFRVMFKHILPNALGTIITSSVLVIPGVIFSESMLSYLGIVKLGGSSGTSLGTLLSDASGIWTNYPHLMIIPAIVIALLMITFNLFGNGLRDAFNPSLRGSEG